MAIVPDLAGANFNVSNAGRNVDRPLSTVNRFLNVTPYATTTPGYTGEVVQDSSTGQLWLASNLTNTGWIVVTKVI
jgi:hypothetical protein